MKKILLTLSLAATMLVSKSQIIITGVMADPTGTDASVTSGVKAYEYAQFRATQNIDFTVTPYSVVFLYETTTTVLPNAGWASGTLLEANQKALTYQFNLTSGTVNKGEFFYVGGDGKKINGSASTDISTAKWIKAVDYAKNDGESGNGVAKTALLGNSVRANGVAVFLGNSVAETSVPVDAIFYGQLGDNHFSISSPTLGFRVNDNGVYTLADEFYGKGGNTFTAASSSLIVNADLTSTFIKFGGDYNTTTMVWDVPRSGSRAVLNNSSTLADIEAGAGVTTLPVSLITFTARTNKQGSVNLAWSTASEKDNSHFEVTRSTNGIDFEKLHEVKGSGNSDVVRNYSYTDTKPAVGANYYRLKQVDFDGDFAFSSVATAKVGLAGDKLTVSVSANRSSVSVSYTAATNGKALFNIYNVSGAKIATVEQTVNVGANQINIPVNLGNAIHLLNVTQAGASASTKF
ncbi:MAG: hypothetical protein ACO1N4_05060 [Pedobacter sp.]